MSLALVDPAAGMQDSLTSLAPRLTMVGQRFAAEADLLPVAELVASLATVEALARTVEYLQVVGAAAAERQRITKVAESSAPLSWSGPVSTAGDTDPREQAEFKDTADFLRARLRITRVEARRRVRLGLAVTEQPTLTGDRCPPRYGVLAAAFRAGEVGAYAATQISNGVDRVRTSATPAAVRAMEDNLTAQAIEADGDLLQTVLRRWESVLDPDGAEPTEETLRAQQGVFLRGRRRGLQRLEIAADDEQFEYLVTVMNTAANPRLRSDHQGQGKDAVSPHSGCSEAHDRAEPDSAPAPATEILAGDPAGPGSVPMPVREARTISHDAGADSFERRTRPQLLLDGLVGACQVALATDTLPATGGHRPQVMVTIDYRSLVGQVQQRVHHWAGSTYGEHGRRNETPGEPGVDSRSRNASALAETIGYPDNPGTWPGGHSPSRDVGAPPETIGYPSTVDVGREHVGESRSSTGETWHRSAVGPGAGHSVFGGPISARVVRKMACDADIIPIVLGGHGEILDVGRARRLFGVAQRRALVARDKGCAFPSCTIPAVWTEAHHVTPWMDGGRTDISNGCLLCSFHHRLVEQGNWTIDVRNGIPWFTPPAYVDPRRVPRRNEHRELLC